MERSCRLRESTGAMVSTLAPVCGRLSLALLIAGSCLLVLQQVYLLYHKPFPGGYSFVSERALAQCDNAAHFQLQHFLVTSTGPRRLANLSSLKLPTYRMRSSRLPATRVREVQGLRPRISAAELGVFRELLHLFCDLLHELKLGDQFFMSGGTLLGSFRHHDIIPWDDDVDLLLNEDYAELVEKALSTWSRAHQYSVVRTQKLRMKVFRKDGLPIAQYSWKWPFLDIGFFRLNETHLQENANSYGRSYAYKLQDTYPLVYRPLGNLWLPAPHNVLKHIIEDYGQSRLCSVNSYSHILESGQPSHQADCIQLARQYAFVHRSVRRPIESGMFRNYVLAAEALRIEGGETFHTLCLPTHVNTLLVTAFGQQIDLD